MSTHELVLASLAIFAAASFAGCNISPDPIVVPDCVAAGRWGRFHADHDHYDTLPQNLWASISRANSGN